MKKSKAIPPYNQKNRANFPARGKSGVYIIFENETPVYIGYSQKDLYKTMYRHFQMWNHTGQEVVSYSNLMNKKKYTVRVIYCTPKQAMSLEKQLIIKYNPRDCFNKYESYKPNKYDKEVIEKYAKTGISDFKFSKKELNHFLQVMKEDQELEKEQENQAKASSIFGNEFYEKDNNGQHNKSRRIVLNRNEPYSLMYGAMVETNKANKEIIRLVKKGNGKKVIDTEDTLMYINTEDQEFEKENKNQPKAMFEKEEKLEQGFTLLKSHPDEKGIIDYYIFLYTRGQNVRLKSVVVKLDENKVKNIAEGLRIKIEENI